MEIDRSLHLIAGAIDSPIKYTIEHHGPTAAYVSESFIHLYLSHSKTPSTDTVFGFPMPIPSVIVPNTEPIVVHAIFPVAFAENEIDHVWSGDSFAHLVGFIKYRDVFEDDHWIRFNRVWTMYGIITSHFGYWADCGEKQDNQQD